jgi:hypothetical protein
MDDVWWWMSVTLNALSIAVSIAQIATTLLRK